MIPHDDGETTKYIVLLHEIDTGKIIDYLTPFDTQGDATDYAIMMSEIKIQK